MNITSPVARMRSRDPKALKIVMADEDVLSTPSTFCHPSSSPMGYMVILSFNTDIEEWCQRMSKKTGVNIDPVSSSAGEKFSLA